MINASTSPRDRAMLLVLFEDVFRPSELLMMNVSSILFEKDYCTAVVKGKTGLKRIPLVVSYQPLLLWLSLHPFGNNPDAPLWCSLDTNHRGHRLSYRHFKMIIKKAAERSGIKKDVWPYLFRHSQLTLLASALDSIKAKTVAEATPLFQSYTHGYNIVFNSIFNIWSFDSQGDVVWKMVNVVFTMSNLSGFITNIIVTEDPSTFQVLNTSLQARVFTDSSTRTSSNWSGYSFTGNSIVSIPIYEAYATWIMPTVSEPWSYVCFFTHCDLAIWPGLTADSGGSSGIVQAGTDSGLYCTIGCSYYYYGWYEFYPAGSVTCSNSFSPGD